MNGNLALFLQTEELDDAQQLARQLTTLSQTDIQTISQVLDRWDDPQAVANLLMHPDLIPAERRGAALLRGLREPMTYTTLAAIVGLRGRVASWLNADRAVIVERLQIIIFEARPVLADRASLTLLEYARQTDADRLIFLLGYPGEIVQHNVLLALVRLLGGEKTRARVEAAITAKRVTQAGWDFAAAHLDTLLLDDLPLLSYIPNRSDFPVG